MYVYLLNNGVRVETEYKLKMLHEKDEAFQGSSSLEQTGIIRRIDGFGTRISNFKCKISAIIAEWEY